MIIPHFVSTFCWASWSDYTFYTDYPSSKYTWIFENRVSEDKGSFYYLAIKSNKIRPKADKKPISDAEQ